MDDRQRGPGSGGAKRERTQVLNDGGMVGGQVRMGEGRSTYVRKREDEPEMMMMGKRVELRVGKWDVG